MSQLLGMTVEDLVATMKQRQVRIPSEMGTFIALSLCEALEGAPAALKPSEVRIADDGTVSVFAPPGHATSEEAARSVVSILGSLLVAAGTGVPRGLVGLLEHGPSSGRWDLPSLRDDLEASLVPLNRAAARRVLSRMLREAGKARPRGSSMEPSAPPPGDRSLDDQLDALLGGMEELPSVTPEPGVEVGQRRFDTEYDPNAERDLDAELDATIDELGLAVRASQRPTLDARGAPPQADADDATWADDGPARLEAPAAGPAPHGELSALADELDAPKTRFLPWILTLLAVAAATAAALALMRPDLVDTLLGRPLPPPEPSGPTDEDRSRLLREHRARFGTLRVQVSPPRAQVLMHVGQGPAVAEALPLGVAHEFVVIADGRRPARAVLPADAEWEQREDGRRYELAMQAGDEPMSAEELVLGPTRLPPNVGSPSGALGDVRVITNPPGAEVYVLVGFSPLVTVENVRTDRPVELLIYHEDHPLERRAISPGDWEQEEDGGKHASLSVVLDGAD